MIFYTRKLYNGVQPKSGWGQKAEREMRRRLEIWRAYNAIIKPLLPTAAARLQAKSFHDAEVESVTQKSRKVTMILDSRPDLGSYRGSRIRIVCSGVRNKIRTKGLKGQWWLYHEVHLCSRAAFVLHVLFTNSELEIEADELTFENL
ncbi:MAG TPA: DUF4085 family protein [Verrucomicrobiae bacterium]|jgi:hypothetical protein